MLAQFRGRTCRQPLKAGKVEWACRAEDAADARLIDPRDHWIGQRGARVFGKHLAEGPVRRPADSRPPEVLRDLIQRPGGEPRGKRGHDRIPGGIAAAFLVKVQPGLCRKLYGIKPGRVFQRRPLTTGQPDHHDLTPIAGGKVVPEGSVQVVAVG